MKARTQRERERGRSGSDTRSGLLYGYVVAASVVLHLVMLPVFGAWLTRTEPAESVEVKGRCSTEGEVRAPEASCCSNPLVCPAENEPLKVAFVEEEPPKEEEEVEEEPEEYEASFAASPMDPEGVEEIPEEATALGAENRSVEEEMIAKGNAPGVGGGRATPSMGPQAAEGSSASGGSSMNRARERLDPMMMSEAAPDVELPSEGPSSERDGEGEREAPAESASAEALGAEGSESILPDLYSEELLAAEGGGSIDYLDVPEGEKSFWNQKMHAHSGFFGRVKLAVSQRWNPVGVYRRRDPTGKIYGVQDRLTVLAVTLRGNGTVAEVLVSKASGLDFMDDEAVRAMKAAGPFPNPPEALKGKDGLIRFDFGFYFEITTRKFRAFRYR